MIPPREFPEYVPPGYYALFFKDPQGIKYEIVHTPAQPGQGSFARRIPRNTRLTRPWRDCNLARSS